MDEQITIIDGPPPVFEHVDDAWAMGLNESPHMLVPAMTKLRTRNGNALVERCHRAWRQQGHIHLHYKNEMGLEQTAPILAARTLDTPNGPVLLLWVYLDREQVEYEVDDGEDDSVDDDRTP